MQAKVASISAAGNLAVAGAGGGSLVGVHVNTAAASAVFKIYNNTSAVAADLIATIDAAAAKSLHYEDAFLPKGIFCVLSGGNADITVIYR